MMKFEVPYLLPWPPPSIVQEFPDGLDWCNGVLHEQAQAGDFLRRFAEAVQRADAENVQVLLVPLLQLMAKYPDYLEQERARK